MRFLVTCLLTLLSAPVMAQQPPWNDYPAVSQWLEKKPRQTPWVNPCPGGTLPQRQADGTYSCGPGVGEVTQPPPRPYNPCERGICPPGVGMEGLQMLELNRSNPFVNQLPR